MDWLSKIFGAENFWMAILLIPIKTDQLRGRPKPERWACPMRRHGLPIENFRDRKFLDGDSVDSFRNRTEPKGNRNGAETEPKRSQTSPNRNRTEPNRGRIDPKAGRTRTEPKLYGAHRCLLGLQKPSKNVPRLPPHRGRPAP